MPLFSRPGPANQEDYETRFREARRTMQNIVIAHAAICYKHMTAEQFAAVQADWAKLIRGKGWAGFFGDDNPPPAMPKWWVEAEAPASDRSEAPPAPRE